MATSASNTICVIGAGHMGLAIVRGLLKSGIPSRRITVATPHTEKAKSVASRGVTAVTDNARGVTSARVVILAVKPTMVLDIVKSLGTQLKSKTIVSVAAGVQLKKIISAAPSAKAVFRIMPNLPVASGKGVIGIYGGKSTSGAIELLMKRLGTVIHVKREEELDALTLVSGCGPGVVAYVISILEDEARRRGFSARDAETIAVETFAGTIAELRDSSVSSRELMKAVATKGGVTESIIAHLEKKGTGRTFRRAYEQGMRKIKSIRA